MRLLDNSERCWGFYLINWFCENSGAVGCKSGRSSYICQLFKTELLPVPCARTRSLRSFASRPPKRIHRCGVPTKNVVLAVQISWSPRAPIGSAATVRNRNTRIPGERGLVTGLDVARPQADEAHNRRLCNPVKGRAHLWDPALAPGGGPRNRYQVPRPVAGREARGRLVGRAHGSRTVAVGLEERTGPRGARNVSRAFLTKIRAVCRSAHSMVNTIAERHRTLFATTLFSSNSTPQVVSKC